MLAHAPGRPDPGQESVEPRPPGTPRRPPR